MPRKPPETEEERLRVKEYYRQYSLKNRERRREAQIALRAAATEEDRERYREYSRQWRTKNPEKAKAGARTAMAKLRAADPEKYRAQVRASYRKHREKRLATSKEKWPEVRERENARRTAHYFANHEESKAKDKVRAYQTRLTSPWSKLILGAAKRAAKKAVPFSLTNEWAVARWTGRCEVTGLEFRLGLRERGPKFWSPSIDRIIPSVGYTPENCRFVLWAVNSFKHDSTDEDMMVVAKAIVSKNPSKSDG